MEEFVTIAEVEPDEAALLKAILEGRGITVFIANEHASSLWTLSSFPAKVQVPKDQAVEAQEILGSMRNGEDRDDEDFDDESE